MTVKSVSELTVKQMQKMNESQLREALGVLNDAANKRIKRLKSTTAGAMSPALKNQPNKFSSKGLVGKTPEETRSNLIRSLQERQQFMGMKSSTKSGWSKIQKERYDLIGGNFKDDTKKEAAYWDTYQRIMSGPQGEQLKARYKEVMNELYEMIEEGDESAFESKIYDINQSVIKDFELDKEDYDADELASEGIILRYNFATGDIEEFQLSVNNPSDIDFMYGELADSEYRAEQKRNTSNSRYNRI